MDTCRCAGVIPVVAFGVSYFVYFLPASVAVVTLPIVPICIVYTVYVDTCSGFVGVIHLLGVGYSVQWCGLVFCFWLFVWFVFCIFLHYIAK